uniref:V-type proton ATPase subunit a n=1 Tax=Arcella intermedia TaxID=1963864 RepID=A0A6B2L633_9EUKA
MIEMFYGGRYLIFLMALFAIYQGALYNEFFSLPMNFGSAWRWEYGPGFDNSTFYRADPAPGKAYVFGVDPVWKGATNELLYYNSVKMKMSIIIGVSQMTLGIFLHLLNALHFKHKLDIFFEFLPRIVFLWCIFGYLCIMIIVKWTIDWPGRDIYNKQYRDYYSLNSTDPDPFRGTSKAPVLLNELIYMALLPPEDARNALYDGQYKLQLVLVVIAVLCIPLMMCAKPFFLYRQHKNSPKAVTVINDSPGTEELIRSDEHEEEEEEFNFSEIMVHQGLETIEFVLGSVSHTASYLRLWALSLAHSELATVFWDKVMFMLMRMAPSAGMPFIVVAILMFIAHSVWFFVTLLVMMFMEGLSAFLHALRLHWVEFQSKFYRGDGRVFQPFSYSNMNGMEE